MLDSPHAWILGLTAALCIGLSKAGFSGISLISVMLLAELYGAKQSVGLALPLLIAADLIVYPSFRKHGSWQDVWKLLAPTLVGLGIGWWLLGRLSDEGTKRAIGAIILVMVAVEIARRLKPQVFDRIAHSRAAGAGTGMAAGFSTMLANAAGPMVQLYLLARKVPKMDLLGTGARFFLLVNLIKVPLNSQLALITPASLMENARLLPGVIVGIFGGRWLIRRVPQRVFEWMVVGFAAVAGTRLLFA